MNCASEDRSALDRELLARQDELHAYCYRMLGSVHDADDAVLTVDYGPDMDPHDASAAPPVETAWVEPYPDPPEAGYELRESVELAFVAALQHLSANQRAVLILREVLDFSACEVAESLGTTTAAVNSTLQRARKLTEERLPEQSQQATLRSLGDDRLREIVQRYVQALEQGDVDAYGPMNVRWRHATTRANGQVAVGCYASRSRASAFPRSYERPR